MPLNRAKVAHFDIISSPNQRTDDARGKMTNYGIPFYREAA